MSPSSEVHSHSAPRVDRTPPPSPKRSQVGVSAGRPLLLTVLALTIAWTCLGGRIDVGYWVAATSSMLLIIAALSKRPSDIFHPWAFPQAYLTYVLIAPWFFMAFTELDLHRIPHSSTEGTAATVIVVSTLAWQFGTTLGANTNSLTPPLDNDQTSLERHPNRWEPAHYHAIRSGGAVLLALTMVLKAIQVLIGRGRAYGEGQATLDTFNTITPVIEGLAVAAVLMLTLTAMPLGKKILPPWLLAVLLIYAAASLLFLGSRGELIAPALLVIWYATRSRRVHIVKLLPLAIICVLVFNWVGDRRVSGESVAGMEDASAWERSLVDTSSPFLVTYLLAEEVPDNAPHTHGSTYLESGKYLLPGYLSRSLFGVPQETASLKFRDLLGTDGNSGLGFSLPSEAYLNFGMLGALTVPLILATLFSMAYRLSPTYPRRLRAVIYPIAFAILPYGLRADSLAQAKMLLYPLIFVGLSTIFATRRARRAE